MANITNRAAVLRTTSEGAGFPHAVVPATAAIPAASLDALRPAAQAQAAHLAGELAQDPGHIQKNASGLEVTDLRLVQGPAEAARTADARSAPSALPARALWSRQAPCGPPARSRAPPMTGSVTRGVLPPALLRGVPVVQGPPPGRRLPLVPGPLPGRRVALVPGFTLLSLRDLGPHRCAVLGQCLCLSPGLLAGLSLRHLLLEIFCLNT